MKWEEVGTITLQAAKASTLVDDFRNKYVDNLLWTVTGSAYHNNFEGTTPRGLLVTTNSLVTSYNGLVGIKRLDLYDSEVVWTINSWIPSTGTVILKVQNVANTFGYRFEYSCLTGAVVVKSLESGVTYTGANFLDGSGNVAYFPPFPHQSGMIRYVRIAHSATTGKVEFFAGASADGSDQRLFTSDLGTGAKGTMTATQANLDDVVVSMECSGTANVTIGSINAPNDGINKYPDSPTTFYSRDFSSWVGYNTNQFLATNGLLNHEWYVRSAGNSIAVTQDSPSTKSLRMTGQGSNLASLTTQFVQGIKNVNIKVTAAMLPNADTNAIYGISWRNASTTIDGMQRYQLTVLKTYVSLEVFPYTVGASTTYESTSTKLSKSEIANVPGVKYNWEINHFEDRLIVKRDGVEVLSFTDIASSNPMAGNIGLVVGGLSSGSAVQVSAIFDKIEVTEAYDDQNFTRGAMLQDRKIGFHVKSGYRTGYTTMDADPTILSSLEDSLSLPNNNTVYLYSDISTGLNGAVDTAMITTAKQYAREGRTVVICLNGIYDTFGSLNPLNPY